MSRVTVALLSDFGTRDHYVSAMKGVILGVCPDAALVDITHEIPPHDIARGALHLAAVYQYFPEGTIFLAVVDPGVGSSRRGMAADVGDYRFVTPDNGVLTTVFQQSPPKEVVELTERRYARPTVSRTFEGRDRFAPAAAWLGRDVQLSALGRPLTDYEVLELPVLEITAEALTGRVVVEDHFGNLVSNIDRNSFESFIRSSEGSVEIRVGSNVIQRLVETYADISTNEVCGIFGSLETLEFAARSTNARELLEMESSENIEVKVAKT